MNVLPQPGFLRLRQIIGDPKAGIAPIIPVSKSTFLAKVRSGEYPQPTRALGERITAWTTQSIQELIERSSPAAAAAAANDDSPGSTPSPRQRALR